MLSHSSDGCTWFSSIHEDSIIINSVRASNHSPSLSMNQQFRRQQIIPRFLIQTGETYTNYQSCAFVSVMIIILFIITATISSLTRSNLYNNNRRVLDPTT